MIIYMDSKTYEALKRVLENYSRVTGNRLPEGKLQNDLRVVETWIDKVAKEYEPSLENKILSDNRITN